MTWCETFRLDEMKEGTPIRYENGDVRLALFRIGDDVYALGDVCSHAEASLSEGEVFDYEVECPLHGASFDVRTGSALTLPATRPVASHAVRIEDGTVLVEVG